MMPLNPLKKKKAVNLRMQTLNSSTLCLLPSPEAREMAFLLDLTCRHQQCAHFMYVRVYLCMYIYLWVVGRETAKQG